MVLPGLLIEYLIGGVLAAIATLPWWWDKVHLDSVAFGWALLAAGLYVVGMAVDCVARIATKLPKKLIRTWIDKKCGFTSGNEPGASFIREARFAIHAPELAKESAQRSSRDRIARDAIISSILATIAYWPLPYGPISFLLASVMWVGFETVSYKFERYSEQELGKKISI